MRRGIIFPRSLILSPLITQTLSLIGLMTTHETRPHITLSHDLSIVLPLSYRQIPFSDSHRLAIILPSSFPDSSFFVRAMRQIGVHHLAIVFPVSFHSFSFFNRHNLSIDFPSSFLISSFFCSTKVRGTPAGLSCASRRSFQSSAMNVGVSFVRKPVRFICIFLGSGVCVGITQSRI